MTSDFKSFLFTGIMATQCIRDMQLKGQLQPSLRSDDSAKDAMLATVPRDIRAGSHAMQHNYRLVFVFENVLRELISSHLHEVEGPEWFSKCASSSLKQKVQNRQKNEKRHSWHPGIDGDDICYLDLTDLAELIADTWQHFGDFFPNPSWIETRIADVARSRNVIAHANILTADESTRIEMYLKDVLKQVG